MATVKFKLYTLIKISIMLPAFANSFFLYWYPPSSILYFLPFCVFPFHSSTQLFISSYLFCFIPFSSLLIFVSLYFFFASNISYFLLLSLLPLFPFRFLILFFHLFVYFSFLSWFLLLIFFSNCFDKDTKKILFQQKKMYILLLLYF